MNSNELKAMRTDRLYKAWVWLLVTVGLVVALKFIVDAYVKLSDDPPWLRLISMLISTTLYLFIPFIAIAKAEKRFRTFTVELAARLSTVESLIDPKRTSSGLRTDGTDPNIGGGA